MSEEASRAQGSPEAELTLARVAELTGGRLEDPGGDGSRRMAGVAPAAEAGADDLAFLAARRYSAAARRSAAGAFLVSEELEDHVSDRPRVVVADGHRALQALLTALHPVEPPEPGVHSTAVMGRRVRLGEGVRIDPYAVLGDEAVVGDGTHVGAHVVLGAGATVGAGCVLHPQVVLYPGTVVGDRVVLHAGSRLGVEGFGWAEVDGVPRKVPQVGGCRIGDDVEVGANSTVDRGSIGNTVVEPHAKLDNLVHLAHNVRLGSGSLLAALVGIAGSTQVGRGVLMGGQSGVINHLRIGDGARIAAAAKVLRDVEAGEVASGHPARPNREYLRKQAHLSRLPRLVARVEELEERLARLEEGEGAGERRSGEDGTPPEKSDG
jgi:UDP-3-O-[3-hydroxymyristoyl] glucosamine N-acyltransferase